MKGVSGVYSNTSSSSSSSSSDDDEGGGVGNLKPEEDMDVVRRNKVYEGTKFTKER